MSVVAELVRHQDAQVEAITVEFERLVSGGDWSLAESFLARLPPAVAFKLGVTVATRHKVSTFDLKQFCGLSQQ